MEEPFEKMQYQPYQPPVNTKLYYRLMKRDRVFALLALILGVVDVTLTLWGGFTAGFTVSFVLTFAMTTVYLLRDQKRIGVYPLLCALLALAGSGVFAVQEYGAVNFFLILMLFGLSAIWCHSLGNQSQPAGDGETLAVIFSSTFGGSFGGLGAAGRSLLQKESGKTGKLGKILLGALCAVPVLSLVIPLLIRSDAAFEGLARAVQDDLQALMWKGVLGIGYGALLISYAYFHRMHPAKPPTEQHAAGIDGVYVSAFLGMVSLCYLTYLLSQLAYFFDSFSGILPEAYKAADYARRGFFEMCAIGVINLIVLTVTLAASRKEKGKPCVSVRIFSLFICLFTLVIVGTALSKMFMYIDRFGMTRLRIVTSAFMVFLGILFVLLAGKYFAPKIPVVKAGLVVGSCILLLLGYGNVSRTVAEYNINAYHTGKLSTLDVSTISELGTEGVPYLVELTEEENRKIAEAAWESLYCKVHDLYEENDRGEIQPVKRELGMWNLAQHRAYRALNGFLEKTDYDIWDSISMR